MRTVLATNFLTACVMGLGGWAGGGRADAGMVSGVPMCTLVMPLADSLRSRPSISLTVAGGVELPGMLAA